MRNEINAYKRLSKLNFQMPCVICLLTFVFFMLQLMRKNYYSINRKITFSNPLYPKDIGENIALQNINTILSANGYSLNDFNLSEISEYQKDEKLKEDINTSEYIIRRNIFNVLSLSNEQREIFNKIMESINDNNYNYNKCFFIDSPGGSGKSYLLNSLITHLNNENINVFW